MVCSAGVLAEVLAGKRKTTPADRAMKRSRVAAHADSPFTERRDHSRSAAHAVGVEVLIQFTLLDQHPASGSPARQSIGRVAGKHGADRAHAEARVLGGLLDGEVGVEDHADRQVK
jgi:hypothetical protein